MAGTRLRVSCRGWGRLVALVRAVGVSALAVMTIHLQQRHTQEPLGDDPSREVILAHFAVTPSARDDEPPDVA